MSDELIVDVLISRIVSHHEIMPNESRCLPEYFRDFKNEWTAICEYHQQTDSLPNVATFLNWYPEFPFVETPLTAQHLLETVEQKFIGRLLDDGVRDILDLRALNPRDAANMLPTLTRKVHPYANVAVARRTETIHSSFIKQAERLRGDPSLSDRGITSGFDLLDEHLRGTAPGELEVWFGRTGEGKSLMLQFSSLQACRQGKSVSYISPEMNLREIGARMYSMLLGVSSADLLAGTMPHEEFNEFMSTGDEFFGNVDAWGNFYFRESRQRGGRFTTADIAAIIAADKPDLVAIDGLMFIDPVKDDRETRKRIMNTMEELKGISTDTGVPMRIAHQANRESDISSNRRNREVSLDDMLPNLVNLAESASVEHYANKVIAIKLIGDRMHLAVRKNRTGKAIRFISFNYQIDTGYMSDMQVDRRDKSVASRDISQAADTRQKPYAIF